MLSGISVVCFASSYGVAMLLELTRFFVRTRDSQRGDDCVRGSRAVRTQRLLDLSGAGTLAAGPAVGDLVCRLSDPGLGVGGHLPVDRLESRRSTAGLLLLPTSLALIAAAHLFPKASGAVRFWSLVHGLSLAVGTALVVVGFLAGCDVPDSVLSIEDTSCRPARRFGCPAWNGCRS